MKTINYFILIIITLLISCKTVKKSSTLPIHYKERVVEKLIPVAVSADSSTIKALFECDSLNNVIIKELSEKKGKNVSTNIKLDRGEFKAKTLFRHDTMYVKAKDSIVYKEIPVKIEVIKEVNKLTPLQKTMIKTGYFLLIALIGMIIYFVLKVKEKGFKVVLKFFWKSITSFFRI